MDFIKGYQLYMQVLGQNKAAQNVLQSVINTAWPSLAEKNIAADIVEKYYDWKFPFRYTSDGGGDNVWRAKVKAAVRRAGNLPALSAWYGALDPTNTKTQSEQYGGTDGVIFTDNRETVDTDKYNALGTTTGGTNDTTTHGFTSGKNTTDTATTYGRSRTWTDGRTPKEVADEAGDIIDPVYKFICDFAAVLLPPEEC